MKQQSPIILCLLTISSLAFQACQNTSSFEKTAFKSPLKNVEITFETRKIQAETAQLVRLENGSSIQIPKDAFVDANGSKVTGKMDLGYRQFDDPADIIASGIPMTFENEEGKKEQLESGGMFELRGSVGGKPVFVAPGKSIKTTLASSVAGAYDFYYLESEGAVETASNSKWKKLTNTIDEIPASTFQAPDSFQMKYNLTDYPILKPFEGIQWKLWKVDEVWNPKTSANNWALEEEWNRVEFSQPKMTLKQTKKIMGGAKSGLSYSPDRTFFVADNDAKMESYDINGKLLGTTSNVHEYSYINFLSETLFSYSNKDKNIVVSNKNLKSIATIGNAVCLEYQAEKERLYFLQMNASDYESTLFKAINKKGQELFSRKINLVDDRFFLNEKLLLTNDQQHLYLNVKEGVEILDLEGKRVAFLKRKETYETIDYNFKNNNFKHYDWSYYNQGNKPRPSKNDVVTIIQYDGSLMIWDWKKDKKYTSKGLDLRDKGKDEHYHITFQDNHTYPFVRVREDGAKYSKTWYWEEGRMVENTEVGYRQFSPMGKFVSRTTGSETNNGVDTYSGIVTTYSGKEILTYNGVSYMMEGPDIVNYGQGETLILISIPQGDHILYDSKGKLIKDFRKSHPTIFYSFFNYDQSLVYAYTLDGLVACWDVKGTLIWETEINELILDPYRLKIRDSSILVRDKNRIDKEYDLKGRLLVDYNAHKNYSYYITKGETLQENMVLGDYHSYSDTEHFFANKELLPDDPNLYQVTFFKDKKTFTTFVYLDGNARRLVEEYRAEEARLQMEEFARSEVEIKLKRSFEVQSFGIYNWDRFYKDESETMVRCEAEFNLRTEYNDIAVFLITGAEQNTVIQYNKGSFDKFSFNTAYYNKLVAILPNNEIAIFENEDFQGLDVEKIKTTKKHRFELRKMGGVAALEELKKMTAPPS